MRRHALPRQVYRQVQVKGRNVPENVSANSWRHGRRLLWGESAHRRRIAGVGAVLSLALVAGGLVATAPAQPAGGLVQRCKLDETSGTVAADSSGNGRNGTVQGTAAVGRAHSAALPGDSSQHVAVTVNSATKTATMYLNGTAIATATGVGVQASDLFDSTKGFSGYIGKSLYSADPYFSGEIDNFRIYGRAGVRDRRTGG
jgi:Concanavalin A-like lectin/glucanases superfamily